MIGFVSIESGNSSRANVLPLKQKLFKIYFYFYVYDYFTCMHTCAPNALLKPLGLGLRMVVSHQVGAGTLQEHRRSYPPSHLSSFVEQRHIASHIHEVQFLTRVLQRGSVSGLKVSKHWVGGESKLHMRTLNNPEANLARVRQHTQRSEASAVNQESVLPHLTQFPNHFLYFDTQCLIL